MKCICEKPGKCPRFDRVMDGRLYSVCRNECFPLPCPKRMGLLRHLAHVSGISETIRGFAVTSGPDYPGLNRSCVHGDFSKSVDTAKCSSCPGSVRIKLFACSIHGTCTIGKKIDRTSCCLSCNDYKPEEEQAVVRQSMRWSYGVTTIAKRRGDLLPRTLESLAKAGFDRPRLFVDEDNDPASWEREFGLQVTSRSPKIFVYGNWLLTMLELWIREAHADRYAIFQDDLVCYRDLKEYLERSPFPEKGYCNLYTFPQNLHICPKEEGGEYRQGWFPSNQRGRGAVALVFDNEGAYNMLQQGNMYERSKAALPKGQRNADGAIVTAFIRMGWREYCHNPSLVQHTGLVSSHTGKRHPLANSFMGEDFSALELLEKESCAKTGSEIESPVPSLESV